MMLSEEEFDTYALWFTMLSLQVLTGLHGFNATGTYIREYSVGQNYERRRYA
jgi:hypothetical protein